MIRRWYLEKTLNLLVLLLFVIVGLVSLHDDQTYDMFFLGTLIFAALICRQNLDVIGVICIVIGARTIQYCLYMIFNQDDPYRLPIYIAAIFTGWFFRRIDSSLVLMLMLTTCIMICVDLYWLLISYPPPGSHYYLTLCIMSILGREAIYQRATISEKLINGFNLTRQVLLMRFKNTLSPWPDINRKIEFTVFQPIHHLLPIGLDHSIKAIFTLGFYIQIPMIGEYTLRHLPVNDLVPNIFTSLYYYNAYPLLSGLLGLYLLWCIFWFGYQILIKQVKNKISF